MNRKIITLLLISILTLTGCGNSNKPIDTTSTISTESTESELATYLCDEFCVVYDDSEFSVQENNLGISINPNISDQGGHNTILVCMSTDNTEYTSIKETDYQEFNKEFCTQICQGLFALDEGITIENESFNSSTGYEMVFSDGTKCYTKLLSYGETIWYAACRLCEYSESVNDDLYITYNTCEGLLNNTFYDTTSTVTSMPIIKNENISTEEKSTTDSTATSIEMELQSYLSSFEKNTSEVVDEISRLAKQNSTTATEQELNDAINAIHNNYPQYYNGPEQMELFMYYGYLLDYAFDDTDPRSELGMDICQAIKYVYRNVETVLDSATKENLEQIKKDLQNIN